MGTIRTLSVAGSRSCASRGYKLVGEVAAELGVSATTLRRMEAEGVIPEAKRIRYARGKTIRAYTAEELKLIDGHLYQVQDDGNRNVGWVALDSPYPEMDERTFEVRDGELVELRPAEIAEIPQGAQVTQTNPLGTHPVHGPPPGGDR